VATGAYLTVSTATEGQARDSLGACTAHARPRHPINGYLIELGVAGTVSARHRRSGFALVVPFEFGEVGSATGWGEVITLARVLDVTIGEAAGMAAGEDPAVVGLEADVTVRVRGVDQPGEVKVFVRGTYERYIAHSETPIPVGARVRVLRGHGPRAVDVVPLGELGGQGPPSPDPRAISALPRRLDALLAEQSPPLPDTVRAQVQHIRAGVFTLTRYPLSEAGEFKVEAVVNAVVERVRAYRALIHPNVEDQRQLGEQLQLLAGHVNKLLGDLDRDLRAGINAMDAGLYERFRGSELDLPD
jgi:hypothetical protein